MLCKVAGRKWSIISLNSFIHTWFERLLHFFSFVSHFILFILSPLFVSYIVTIEHFQQIRNFFFLCRVLYSLFFCIGCNSLEFVLASTNRVLDAITVDLLPFYSIFTTHKYRLLSFCCSTSISSKYKLKLLYVCGCDDDDDDVDDSTRKMPQPNRYTLSWGREGCC